MTLQPESWLYTVGLATEKGFLSNFSSLLFFSKFLAFAANLKAQQKRSSKLGEEHV